MIGTGMCVEGPGGKLRPLLPRDQTPGLTGAGCEAMWGLHLCP